MAKWILEDYCSTAVCLYCITRKFVTRNNVPVADWLLAAAADDCHAYSQWPLLFVPVVHLHRVGSFFLDITDESDCLAGCLSVCVNGWSVWRILIHVKSSCTILTLPQRLHLLSLLFLQFSSSPSWRDDDDEKWEHIPQISWCQLYPTATPCVPLF